jgi:hypothetical protein
MDEVDSILEKEPEAAGYMLGTVRTTARLRAGMNAVLHEEIPQRLLDTLSPRQIARSRRRPLARKLIRAAAVIILGFCGFGLGIMMERNLGENYPAEIAPLPARYSEVVDAALEFNLSGKSREWRAPRGSIAVKVTPVKTYRDKAGVYYREYRMEVDTDSRQSHINGLAYRTASGKWNTKVLYF